MRPLLIVAMILTSAACAPTRSGGERADVVAAPSARQGGTLKLAWTPEPDSLAPKFASGSGLANYLWPFSSSLTYLEIGGVARPMLAQEIPTQANGGWVVNPDGTMITTYRLRPNARWHDGTPLTAQDFVFAFEVYTDKEIPVSKASPEHLMESVAAQDDSTIVVRWKEPYVNANTLGFEQLLPLPRHTMQAKFRSDKATFVFGQEWNTAYISTGPFKVDRWTPGVGIVATANMDFVLGPPKLDAIDIRFIPDSNAQVANLLSGEVDMVNSPGVRAREALIVRDQWGASSEGYIKAWSTGAPYLDWQFREVPNWQRAIGDIRVRQALLHATDKEGINEAINLGFSPVVHAFISPEDPLFPEVDRVITKYVYDGNRAAALLVEAGWRRPSGSGLLTNSAGQTFDVELFTTQSQQSQATIIADNWKGAGVNSTLFVVPQAQARDDELATHYTAARVNNRQLGVEQFIWTSREFSTPENRWSGSNRGSFFDPEIEHLQNLRLTSLDESERRGATVSVLKRLTELAGPTPFLYAVEVILARSYVVGPLAKLPEQGGMTWNIHEWEVTRSG